ncbi:thiocyanate hydrolase subunit beta [Mycolicibacterium mageritense DSM 44476 = CIP 104973]|uniref:nitrile hydratase n=1 Tax=Mycolicibacterium mageritense TaxID=53462 RepID=A0ABM7HTC3_MYCME|nr:nitrile hydratase subunit beta [Mycolicibacterium mageritense]MCC9182944.1 nitrile hydratase subunit beta [Mycolicibacterium mageritense]BBX33820.1 nitrile hydratase subunit beta [Mycolicibacterium mageritense]GJJ19966.1 nitrile hydratase subunit beta [Mycolicibacterium mageritense]CDO22245.1 thiocyanate hydrolase subunit beta [Mycolicibacterium mageritense DSM 44476 = CIP 104973]
MSTAAERAAHLDLVGRLKSAFPEMPDAPPPDLLDHERFLAYMKTVHDVGGEPDAPMKYENKDYEYWEHMTYVICEVLAWRGIWLSEERRRIGNVDVGRAIYQGFPYYGRWLWAVARVLVEKHHISLGELTQRMAEVKGRYEGGLAGRKLEAQPKSEGDGADVKRNEHHIRAVGKGDPQVYAGQAGEPKFRVGDAVLVRELPILLYTRTPEYVRGARGEIAEVTYESPAAEDETWDRTDATPEWFYIVRFNQSELWHGYTGTATDTLQTEIPERWLEKA